MKFCETCQGLGHIALRGDDDRPCPSCQGTGLAPSPAPVIVSYGPYRATVTIRNGLVHVTNTFIGEPEPLVNSFLSYDLPFAMGRALVLACRPAAAPARWYGWDYRLSDIGKAGWLVFKGQMFRYLPNAYSLKGGYEVGVALIQMGVLMEARQKIGEWIGELDIPKGLAV